MPPGRAAALGIPTMMAVIVLAAAVVMVAAAPTVPRRMPAVARPMALKHLPPRMAAVAERIRRIPWAEPVVARFNLMSAAFCRWTDASRPTAAMVPVRAAAAAPA